MFSMISNGLAGMLASQRAVDVSGAHIAGMSARVQPAQGTASPSAIVTLSAGAADYAREAVDSISAKEGFQLSAETVKVADQLLGTLVNLKA